MKHIIYNDSGSIDSMEWMDGKSLTTGDEQVKINVKAFSLNRADLLQREGMYPPPPGESSILGLECSGEVIETGKNCSKFKVGDRVMCLLAGGGYATEVVVNEALCMAIPENLDFVQAAAIPESFLTAYQCLRVLGHVHDGNKVLIHAGGSGLGTAAIQICNLFNATSIVTAGTDEKLAFCKHLGASLTINYKEADFKDEIEKEYGKNKINIVMDVIGKPYVERNTDVLAVDGNWILIAFMGGARAEQFPLFKILSKRIKLTGTTLRARSLDYKGKLIDSFKREVLHAFSSGSIKPVIYKTFRFEDIKEATRCMENNENIGKLVITF
ncbi:NAD(P)H-quinone oxidoreductase [Marinigracilibium pacificum]|uniref:NAD(P)H-quinone oxidoreductase n=1 Tax=Marinigracilibium pacificum TaxID=2729599 RepID=A0A848J0V1_9BACT|nr:NAD(P)H-quinone oxidoreductase [Marinigracilibium pacificum]NMM48988.1 NAD(P)H-quinone oxidoreductase [Marinigracilibium pacificum]